MSSMPNGGAKAQAQPTKSLLGGLALKAEHMIALGCGGLLIVIVVCVLSIWFGVSNWNSAGDPAPAQRSQVGQSYNAMPDCESRHLRVFTQERNGQIVFSCGR